jgi:hypothetical protein
MKQKPMLSSILFVVYCNELFISLNSCQTNMKLGSLLLQKGSVACSFFSILPTSLCQSLPDSIQYNKLPVVSVGCFRIEFLCYYNEKFYFYVFTTSLHPSTRVNERTSDGVLGIEYSIGKMSSWY